MPNTLKNYAIIQKFKILLSRVPFNMSDHCAHLRHLLTTQQILVAPGVYDGLSARLVEQAGFSVIYASGGAIARSAGFPDIGLLSFSEIYDRLKHITENVNLPVIADADTGYGNVLNVRRTVQLLEKLGLAGLHLEDQQEPKRCGHLDNKKLISEKEMVQKIRAAVLARKNPNFLLIARTDAIAVEGFESALQRAHAYAAAGADMVFVEAPQTIEQIERIGKEIKTLKLINMFVGGKTPLVPLAQLQAWGYQLVIIPSDLQRAAIHAMQKSLLAIKAEGDSHTLLTAMASFQDREALINTQSYFDFDHQCDL